MSKLSTISLQFMFILTICILMSNLSSEESGRNDSESAEHRIQKRAVGGRYTYKYKDTVFRLQLDSGYYCTGTFIAPDAILTATHCCVNVKSNNVSVYSVYNAHFGRTYRLVVRKYHINPDYKSGILNDDIAIIELAVRPSRSSRISRYHIYEHPATLDYRRVKCGDTVWMYSYGIINPNKTTERYVLQELPSNVSKCQVSRRDLIYTHTLNGSMCFDDDAGAPMFNRNGKLVGVHSGGGNNCSEGGENYSVRLSAHIHFIKRVLYQRSASSTLNLNSLIIFFSMIAFYSIYY